MNYNRIGILTEVLEFTAHKKIGLFSKKLGNNSFLYVDLRDQVGSTGCYFKLGYNDKEWKINRLIKYELINLKKYGLDYGDLIESFGKEGWVGAMYEDGFCEYCKKDFKDNGRFCSKVCEKTQYFENIRMCELCYSPIEGKIIPHHVEYFPEEIILICDSCHATIHFTWDYPHLRPRKGDAEKFYRLDKIQNILTIKNYNPRT